MARRYAQGGPVAYDCVAAAPAAREFAGRDMEIDISLLAPPLPTLAGALAACVLLLALWRAPWRALLAVNARQHLFFATILSLALLWFIELRPHAGVELHFLGMTAATVLLGWSFASLAGLVALLLLAGLERIALPALPLAWLLSAVVPALAISGLLWLLERSRVRNLFVFLLGVGFAGGMLAVLAVVPAALLVLVLGGQDALARTAIDHMALLPLFLFSEGFINGAAVSTLTVYFPHLVRGFNEARFLGDEDPPSGDSPR